MSDLRWIARDVESTAPGRLEDFFPETAAGDLPQRSNEILVEAGSVVLRGPRDGSVVPILVENLEAMPENIFDFTKLATIVDATTSSPGQYVFDMGYADVTLEHGELVAQVRDGNHRTFGAALAGAEVVPVMLSDSVHQDLLFGEQDALYRAIRKAQRQQGLPLLQRRARRPKGSARSVLEEAELGLLDIEEALLTAQQDFLKRWGFNQVGYDHADQLERAGIFWRTRASDLEREQPGVLDGDPIIQRIRSLSEKRMEALVHAKEARTKAGLDPLRQRFDPRTGKVING